MEKKQSSKVAIIGLGLLGASLALALKETGKPALGWTRKKDVRERFLESGALSYTSDKVEDVIAQADISILCMPVPQIVEFCVEHAKHFKRGAIVSDVGSVKGPMLRQALPVLEKECCVFVGGHPMAGSEKSGPDAANPHLFKRAVVFLTPDKKSEKDAVGSLRSLWTSVGASVHEIDVATHDALLAKSSHLPHVLSWCLALTTLDVEEDTRKLAGLACASSFRDMTRVASSSPELWTGIFEANKESLLNAIDDFQTRLDAMRDALEADDGKALKSMMELGRDLRSSWASGPHSK